MWRVRNTRSMQVRELCFGGVELRRSQVVDFRVYSLLRCLCIAGKAVLIFDVLL